MYSITKNYGPENGLSATFRQWRANSHCRFMHGYALGVRLKMSCAEAHLDENGWVFNFGGLKGFKQYLADTFDHKTLVAKDDPHFDTLRELAATKHEGMADADQPLIQLVEVERTGCEGFAKMIYLWLMEHVVRPAEAERNIALRLEWVEVYEHGGNSAIYTAE